MSKSILDFTKTERFNLTIRLMPDALSFYIVDTIEGGKSVFKTKTFSKNKSILLQVEEAVYQHEELLNQYNRTELIIVSPKFTFVPKDLFVEGREDELLSFQFQHKEDKIFKNEISRQHVINIFSADKEIYNFLHRSLTLNRVVHYSTPLTEYFAERSKFGNYSKMYVNIESNRMDLFCFERSRLNLVNSFAYSSINDAAYYILNTWEKAGFHQTNDELYVCGDAQLRNQLMPLLAQYIQRATALNPPTGWYVAPETDDFLPIDLMTISLCV